MATWGDIFDSPDPGEKAPDPGAISADGTPVEIARALLGGALRQVASLPDDSPRLTAARESARAATKLVAWLESQVARQETPEEVARRRRREDGETLTMIEQYVVQAERIAEEAGVCVRCGAKLT